MSIHLGESALGELFGSSISRRCLLSPFIARSLGRTCRFRRSFRCSVVVAGQNSQGGILPWKRTNIPWKWIVGRWNIFLKWSLFWGHVNFWWVSDIEMKVCVWILFHIWSVHTFQEQLAIGFWCSMIWCQFHNGKMGPCIFPPCHLPLKATQQDPTTGSKYCQCQIFGTSAHAVAVVLSQDKPSNEWLLTSLEMIKIWVVHWIHSPRISKKKTAKGLFPPYFRNGFHMGWVINSHSVPPNLFVPWQKCLYKITSNVVMSLGPYRSCRCGAPSVPRLDVDPPTTFHLTRRWWFQPICTIILPKWKVKSG